MTDSSTKVVPTHALIEAVKNKRAILFLGAGASKEAKNDKGEVPPDAERLRDILAEKFFGRSIKNRDVMVVAEMAIESSGGMTEVFEEVRKAFEGYEPSTAHLLIPTFNWRMIATTNYDLLVERSYPKVKNRVQNLARFVKDDEPVEAKLQEIQKPVPYLKLHGCLEHIHDRDIPLVLGRQQYSVYSQNRTNLFSRLAINARESAIIFVGYRLDDPHIRELIYQLDGGKRPRWYIVTPDAEDFDINFWATKNVEVIKSRFGEFIQSLDESIDKFSRALAMPDSLVELSIRKFYASNAEESEKLRFAFNSDLVHVHSGMSYKDQTAKSFYDGFDLGWGGIIRRFDARRKVEDDLLYKVLLENEHPTEPMLFVLRGPGGAGKTIALKRAAYEAAASNAFVLWLEENGALDPDVFGELYDLCQQPIYLFIDQLAQHVDKVPRLLKYARAKNIPLILIGAERETDWNAYCSSLAEDFSPRFFRVGGLTRGEVEALLDLLERHGCLGHLVEKNRSQQVDAFLSPEMADKQLLVALHELTLSKPFEEIVFLEHQRIPTDQARQLYLDIATMHQFAVNVRAGTISRISGIDFEEYKKSFLEPLKGVVQVRDEKHTGDYFYKTRHARVATLVFRQVCSTDEQKARQFKRIIEGFDVGYSSDMRVLEEITRGRALAESFGRPDDARDIYETSIQIAPKQAFLHQQWAIFESIHPHGSLLLAEAHATIAHDLEPRNKIFIHTQAEVARKRANEEQSEILKDSLRRFARARLNEMPQQDRFVASSRCKLLVDEVNDLSKTLSDTPREHDAQVFAEKLSEAENALRKAQQEHPEDADIIQVEARLRDILAQEDRSLRALERAWAAGPRGAGTAIRLARIYEVREREADVLKVLQEALIRNPDDKPTHHALALYYLRQTDRDNGLIEYHLRKSFSSEDHNFEHRYVLAEFLFLIGSIEDSQGFFEIIDKRAPAHFRPRPPREDTVVTAKLGSFTGSVEGIKSGYAFIRSGSYPKAIFAHASNFEDDSFEDLELGIDVSFRIRFNRSGPMAMEVRVGR
tara:strand:- start:8222 stop:11353 length:3132 start_codon:yes stop_codon:yes gene_type:complete